MKLRKIALPDRTFTRRIGLLWLRASLRTGLIEAFLDQAEAVLNAKTTHKRRGTRRNQAMYP